MVSQSSLAHLVAPFFNHLAWTKTKLHHKHELSPHKTLSRKSSQFILIFSLDPSWQKCPHFQDNTHTWKSSYLPKNTRTFLKIKINKNDLLKENSSLSINVCQLEGIRAWWFFFFIKDVVSKQQFKDAVRFCLFLFARFLYISPAVSVFFPFCLLFFPQNNQQQTALDRCKSPH